MEEIIPDAHKEQRTEGQGGSEPMVVVEQLVKQFGKLRAVNNLNMTIFTGETYGLIGPNGSGKTTLIRMLVVLVRPTNGTIRIMGEHMRSEEHTSELQSQSNLVCRLLLEKKK